MQHGEQQDDSHYVIDQEKLGEMLRLKAQGAMLTSALGGVCTGMPLAPTLHDVLDLACGPGEWAMSLAREHPEMRITGVDISNRMIEFACVQALRWKLAATFTVMDITKSLDFPDASFDLVHIRLIASFMQRQMWAPFFARCFRVLRPGGSLVYTEQEVLFSTDPELFRFMRWWGIAFSRAGFGFAPVEDAGYLGVTIVLPSLLTAAGFTVTTIIPHLIDLSTGQPLHEPTIMDIATAQRLGAPFLLSHHVATPEEVEQSCDRLPELVNKPGLQAHWHLMTISARKPEDK